MDKAYTKALRERGVRITPQRALIWQVLAESGAHFTADELWEQVRTSLPGLEVSTVYRSLQALQEAGLVVESRLPEGPMVFEARSGTHPHLVCEACDRIFHLEDPQLGFQVADILSKASEEFEIRELHIVAKGLCSNCTMKETRE
jgi:Fur family ferric uptake transcriptional regulator